MIEEENDLTAHETNDLRAILEAETNNDIAKIVELATKIKQQLSTVIVGQRQLMDLLIIGLLTKGHILLEGVPGVAKTLTARLFAKSIDAKFSRIQFTPDLMPSDILGTNIFNSKTHDFEFKAGPIFADLVVADEINRAPAKTQAAMFEVMQEAQVSVDGITRQLGDGFMVIATQNPIDNEGTYNLPEAQLDRFLFKVIVDYPTMEEDLAILHRFQNDFDMREMGNIKPVASIADLVKLRKTVESISISDSILQYIAGIIQETRKTGDLFLGASSRAAIWLMKASKAAAAINGRNFVTPDDVRWVTKPVLNHRIILSPQREMEGIPVTTILQQIVEKVEIPR
ncbi:MAG: MoxR family ATPase [Flavobacteriales bacterium]|nr:MoxR family ATPase [Flavobacteriales bacterium]